MAVEEEERRCEREHRAFREVSIVLVNEAVSALTPVAPRERPRILGGHFGSVAEELVNVYLSVAPEIPNHRISPGAKLA